MRGLLCVLVVCQIIQVLAMCIGAFVVGPQAFSLVVEARTFVDPSTQAAFRRILHDLEVVTCDMNLVESRNATAVDRRLQDGSVPVTFHSIMDAAGRLVKHVDDIAPVVKRAAEALDAASLAEGGEAMPRMLSDARVATHRVAMLLESNLPAEALSVARNITNHVASMVTIIGSPNGTVAPMLASTSLLLPLLIEALDTVAFQRALGSLGRTWEKSGKVIEFVSRTLNEE